MCGPGTSSASRGHHTSTTMSRAFAIDSSRPTQTAFPAATSSALGSITMSGDRRKRSRPDQLPATHAAAPETPKHFVAVPGQADLAFPPGAKVFIIKWSADDASAVSGLDGANCKLPSARRKATCETTRSHHDAVDATAGAFGVSALHVVQGSAVIRLKRVVLQGLASCTSTRCLRTQKQVQRQTRLF